MEIENSPASYLLLDRSSLSTQPCNLLEPYMRFTCYFLANKKFYIFSFTSERIRLYDFAKVFDSLRLTTRLSLTAVVKKFYEISFLTKHSF